MKLKVSLLNDQLNAGGAERVLVTIANLLHEKGIDVRVILFLDKSALDEQLHKDIPVFYLKRKGRFDLKAMKLLKKYCNQTDIVHVHSRYNLRYFMVAKFVTGIFKPKIVFHEHVPVLKIDAFTKLLFHKIDAYIAVLESMSDWAKERKIATHKVYYLPNIVTAPSQPIQHSYSINKRIIMVGNIWKFKNQVFAIELMKGLSHNYTLDIYGMINDKQYHETLKTLIAGHNLNQRVRIIEGVSNIFPVLGNYDFAIHTSTHETGPLVLLEYMHAQLPFLTFRTGDVTSQISSELPEFIMDTFSINDWVGRIETVMANEDKLTLAKKTMTCIVDRKYSKESYSNKLLTIYSDVLKTNRENVLYK
jgi:glycosyltransferase involved in cell wall biosynthesis